MAEILTPICLWAQDKKTVFITVELTDVKDPSIDLSGDSIDLKAFGHGAQGDNFYQVHVNFFNRIDVKTSTYSVKERYISFILKKQSQDQSFWSRLQKEETKPAWLRIDFDRWQPEEDPDQEIEDEVEKVVNSITLENRIKSELDKAKTDIKSFIRLAYLAIYNITQGISYSVVFFTLVASLITKGSGALYTAFDDVSNLLITCQLFAVLEIINPLIGVVNTGPLAPLLQVGGRNFVLFGVILMEKELHTSPLLFVLFVVWSVVELIRYPFYALSLFQKTLSWLTYVRYTAWILLYPAGILTEALVILSALPLFAASGKLSFSMPNMANFGFQYSFFLCMYLVMLFGGGFIQLRHMLILRRRKLGTRRRRDVKRD